MTRKNDNYDFEDMDWDGYTQYRPAYPRALYDLIYDHHEAHGGQYSTALDVGSGGGLVVAALASKFPHVTDSDPSELYISQAKAQFAKHPIPADLDFLTRKLEDIVPADLPRGLVDMVSSGEALHWADVDACTPSAARLLKPGGTFAAWLYGVRPAYPRSDPAWQAYEDLVNKYMVVFNERISPVATAHSVRTMMMRFDNMPFDPKEWKDVRRFHSKSDEPMVLTGYKIDSAYSRVDESLESFEWNPDDFMHQLADYEWIEGFWRFLIPPVDSNVTCKEELAELKRAMGARSVKMDWPTALVIATKR